MLIFCFVLYFVYEINEIQSKLVTCPRSRDVHRFKQLNKNQTFVSTEPRTNIDPVPESRDLLSWLYSFRGLLLKIITVQKKKIYSTRLISDMISEI